MSARKKRKEREEYARSTKKAITEAEKRIRRIEKTPEIDMKEARRSNKNEDTGREAGRMEK